MLWAGRGEGAEVDGASLDPEGTKEPQIPFYFFFFSPVRPSHLPGGKEMRYEMNIKGRSH